MDTLHTEERLHAQITLAVDGIPVPPGPNRLRAARRHPARLPALLATAALAAVLALTASLGILRAPREGPPASGVSVSPTTRQPTPPQFTAPPGPLRYPVRTASEVLAGMSSDPFVTGNSPTWDPSSLGTPIFVRALRASDEDVWLVPNLRQGKAFAVFVVSASKDGLGAAGIRVGADNPVDAPPFPVPPLSEERAWQISGLAPVDRGSAELVWMRVDPRSGLLVTESRPLWRVTSRSGAVAYVTSDGDLMSAAQVEALR